MKKFHDPVQEGKDYKQPAKLALKLLFGVVAGVLLMTILFAESTADYLVEEMQESTAKAEYYGQTITQLESLRTVELSKVGVYDSLLSRLATGEKIKKQDIQAEIEALNGEPEKDICDYGKCFVSSENRTTFLKNNASPELQHRGQTFVDVGFDYGIDPDLLVCITFADSGLGKYLKTEHNYGNVGNNDRGDTVAYSNVTEGIMAMGKTLNNQYLGGIQTVGGLSYGGGGDGFVYATSIYDWNNNVLNCLNNVKGLSQEQSLDESYEFRL